MTLKSTCKTPIRNGIHGGMSSLQLASRDGHLEIVGMLLAAGADIESQVDAGPPLILAVGQGYMQIVGRLLAAGARMDPPLQPTALQMAALVGRKEILEIVLAAGANVESPPYQSTTPLQMASMAGNTKHSWLPVRMSTGPMGGIHHFYWHGSRGKRR